MDRRRLEARVFDIVDRIVAGGRAEDDLVECKSRWIDPAKAARRLAGQANAAHGDDVVWIVGLDENGHRVVPLDDTDTANWWPQVQKPFADAVTPDIGRAGGAGDGRGAADAVGRGGVRAACGGAV